MITKDRLRQFISWYQSVQGCVSHHELDWFVKSVGEYLNLDQAVTQEELQALLDVPMPEAFCENCKKNPATEPHTCPYAEDINDDHTTLCTCCEECEHECCFVLVAKSVNTNVVWTSNMGNDLSVDDAVSELRKENAILRIENAQMVEALRYLRQELYCYELVIGDRI